MTDYTLQTEGHFWVVDGKIIDFDSPQYIKMIETNNWLNSKFICPN